MGHAGIVNLLNQNLSQEQEPASIAEELLRKAV